DPTSAAGPPPPPQPAPSDAASPSPTPAPVAPSIPPQVTCGNVIDAGTLSGHLIPVSKGGDLQAVIDQAQAGDEIVLEAGATFTGNFRLPKKTGTQYITIRSSADHLPQPGTRVTPAFAPSLARVVATGQTAA